MEGGQFHSQFHQSTSKFIDQRIKVEKPTQIGENMKFKEIEAKNQVYATNHKHITRESRHCSPTSRICLKNEDGWNPRCRKPQIPNFVLPVRIQGDPSSPRCVEREYGLGSWRGWVGRESFELEVCKNGGEERGRVCRSVEERGRVRYFVFLQICPTLLIITP